MWRHPCPLCLSAVISYGVSMADAHDNHCRAAVRVSTTCREQVKHTDRSNLALRGEKNSPEVQQVGASLVMAGGAAVAYHATSKKASNWGRMPWLRSALRKLDHWTVSLASAALIRAAGPDLPQVIGLHVLAELLCVCCYCCWRPVGWHHADTQHTWQLEMRLGFFAPITDSAVRIAQQPGAGALPPNGGYCFQRRCSGTGAAAPCLETSRRPWCLLKAR